MAGLLMAVAALNLVLSQIHEDLQQPFTSGFHLGLAFACGVQGATLFIFN